MVKMNYKKRVLYAVNGEGMGHAIRSSVIIKHLLKKNEVMIITSDRAFNYLNKKYKNVHNISGFNIVYEYNKVHNTKTIIDAIKKLPKAAKTNTKVLFTLLKSFKPNIIISDFEPFSNIISKIMRLPLISIDNQHILTNCKLKILRKYLKDKLITMLVMKSFIIRPKKYLITTFFYPEIKNKKRASLFPPILRKKILKLKPKQKNFILVYQTSDSYKKLVPMLKKIDEKFIIYGLNKDKKEKNIEFKHFNETNFLKNLASCKAVITNGGFTLIGEALYLKKPLLSVPVKKQFEQILNAIYIDKLGYGEFHEDMNKKIITNFLSNLNKYKNNLNKYKKAKHHSLLKELDYLIKKHSKK